MRAAALVALLLFPLSGCLGADSFSKGPATSTGAPKVYDNSTVEGVLEQAPHLIVAGAATLEWKMENVSSDKPAVVATLLNLAGDLKAAFQGITGDLQLAVFLPVDLPGGGVACGAMPPEAKSFYRARDAGSKTPIGNLTGTFKSGWYHIILVASDDASFTISFDTKNEVKPRKLPAADPFAGGGYLSLTGGREVSAPIKTGNGSWYAWANHKIPSTSTDGGREQSVSIGDCQTNKQTTSSAFGGGGGSNRNPGLVISAAGNQATVDVKGSYKPTVAQLAATSTTLEAAWATARPIPVQPKA